MVKLRIFQILSSDLVFPLTIPSSIHLSLLKVYYKQSGETKPLLQHFTYNSAKHPISSFKRFTFHKTQEYSSDKLFASLYHGSPFSIVQFSHLPQSQKYHSYFQHALQNAFSLYPLPSSKAASTFYVLITIAPSSQCHNPYQSTQVAIIKIHRLSALNSTHLISQNSGGWKYEIRMPAWSGSIVRALSGLQTVTFSLCLPMETEGSAISFSSYKGTQPIMRASF